MRSVVNLTLHRNTASSQLTRPRTPEMTIAPSALSGMCSKTGVSSSSVAPTRHAVNTPARPATGAMARVYVYLGTVSTSISELVPTRQELSTAWDPRLYMDGKCRALPSVALARKLQGVSQLMVSPAAAMCHSLPGKTVRDCRFLCHAVMKPHNAVSP